MGCDAGRPARGGCLVVGALAAPELEPDAFRHPRLWQTAVGSLGGLVLAAALGNGPGHFLLGAVLGAACGFFARFWLDHVP